MSRVYFTRLQFIQLISHPSCLSPGFILTGIPFCCSEFLISFACDLWFNPFWKFLRLENLAWDFGGVNFWSRDFLGSLEALGIFLGFDFCPHSIIPVTWNPEYPPGKQVFQAVPCSWFLGEAEMTLYQDEHAPIKFMTGVSLNIIMGSTLRTVAICYLSTPRRREWWTHKNWRELIVEIFETKKKANKKKLVLWVSHMFIVTPRSTNTSWKVVPVTINFWHYTM